MLLALAHLVEELDLTLVWPIHATLSTRLLLPEVRGWEAIKDFWESRGQQIHQYFWWNFIIYFSGNTINAKHHFIELIQ
jgi:hypothetical protein